MSALVSYLVSPGCTLSREVISCAGGRYARVFTGLTPGWRADPATVTPEDVGAHLDDILTLDGFTVPVNAMEEIKQIAAMVSAPVSPQPVGAA